MNSMGAECAGNRPGAVACVCGDAAHNLMPGDGGDVYSAELIRAMFSDWPADGAGQVLYPGGADLRDVSL